MCAAQCENVYTLPVLPALGEHGLHTDRAREIRTAAHNLLVHDELALVHNDDLGPHKASARLGHVSNNLTHPHQHVAQNTLDVFVVPVEGVCDYAFQQLVVLDQQLVQQLGILLHMSDTVSAGGGLCVYADAYHKAGHNDRPFASPLCRTNR